MALFRCVLSRCWPRLWALVIVNLLASNKYASSGSSIQCMSPCSGKNSPFFSNWARHHSFPTVVSLLLEHFLLLRPKSAYGFACEDSSVNSSASQVTLRLSSHNTLSKLVDSIEKWFGLRGTRTLDQLLRRQPFYPSWTMSPLHNQWMSLYELLRLISRGHPSASYSKIA